MKGMKPDTAPPGMAANVVAFSRFLKQGGIPAHPSAVLDACRAVAAIDIADRGQVHCALRANFVTRRDQLASFDRLYALFWEQGVHLLHPDPNQSPTRPQAGAAATAEEARVDILAPEQPAAGGASNLEVLRKKDLRQLLPEEQPAVRTALQAILAKLATRPSRRSRASRVASRSSRTRFSRTSRRDFRCWSTSFRPTAPVRVLPTPP